MQLYNHVNLLRNNSAPSLRFKQILHLKYTKDIICCVRDCTVKTLEKLEMAFLHILYLSPWIIIDIYMWYEPRKTTSWWFLWQQEQLTLHQINICTVTHLFLIIPSNHRPSQKCKLLPQIPTWTPWYHI